jgi:membrane fusion protein, multidrug efflux system
MPNKYLFTRLWSLSVCLLAYQGLAAAAPPGGIPVKTARVLAATVTDMGTAVGTLRANESVMVRPEIEGRISTIHFQEGQQVKKGALLVSLDDAEVRAQLAAAQAALALAQRKVARTEELVAKNFVSRQALDEDRERLKAGQARVRELEAVLAKYRIYAPFAGQMGLRLVSPGAYVDKGDDIADLTDFRTIKLDVRIPQVYFPMIRIGLPVQARVDAYPGEVFLGVVYAYSPALDNETRSVLVRVRIDNPDGRLRPGMFAKVSAQLASRENSMVIPEQAIVPMGGESFVFKVVQGKAQLTKVVTGARRPGGVEIRQGLKPGDVIVLEGQIKLRPGVPVTALPGS